MDKIEELLYKYLNEELIQIVISNPRTKSSAAERKTGLSGKYSPEGERISQKSSFVRGSTADRCMDERL